MLIPKQFTWKDVFLKKRLVVIAYCLRYTQCNFKLWLIDKTIHLLGHRKWVQLSSKFLGLSYYLQNLSATHINKAYIITLEKDAESMRYAKRLKQQVETCGIKQVAYFYGIDEKHSEQTLNEHNISWFSINPERKKQCLMGCFASHFMLWHKCIELNQAILILENDAEINKTLPPLYFRQVINLCATDYRAQLHILRKWVDERPVNGATITYTPALEILAGAVAYAIKPEGAKRLIKMAQTFSAYETDHFINKMNVNIVECMPLPIGLDKSFLSYTSRNSIFGNR